jgi:arylformamidase
VKPIDISMLLTADLPTWPSSPGLNVRRVASMQRGDEADVSALSMDVHTGTHVDAPRHFIADGPELEAMGLTPFVGTADVVDVGHTDVIDADALAGLVPEDAKRILLRTRNSRIDGFRHGGFRPDYAALSPGGAAWLADRGTALVGIDYLSVQRYDDPPDAHTVLLGAGVCLVEGLVLNHVSAGRYLLACLPLRLDGVEAAPARAILLPGMAQ